MKTKLSKMFIVWAAMGVAILLLAVFLVWKISKQENVTLKIDEIQDVKGLGYSGQRKIVLGGNNDIFVTYRKKYQGKSEIFVAKVFREKKDWEVSGTKAPIALVSGADQRVPSIASDEKNKLHVVWYGADSDARKQMNNRQIKYSQSVDGGLTWTNWRNIALVAGYDGEDYWQEHPYVLTGNQGELFVVWEGKDENNKKQQIKFSKSLDGGQTWTVWKNVRETPDNTQSRPTMVMEKNGRLHLLGYSSFGNSNDKQQIVHAWSDDKGESWSQWKIISDHNSDSRHLSAVIDSDGRINVVWRAMDSNRRSQIVHLFFKDNNWSQAQTVASSNAYQFFPSVGINKNGGIFVTWMESDKASNLPGEDPEDGKVYLSKFVAGKYSKAALISQSLINLYPNLPEKGTKKMLPLLYESQNDSSDTFSLMLNIVSGG
jgi:hypothetical protein